MFECGGWGWGWACGVNALICVLYFAYECIQDKAWRVFVCKSWKSVYARAVCKYNNGGTIAVYHKGWARLGRLGGMAGVYL